MDSPSADTCSGGFESDGSCSVAGKVLAAVAEGLGPSALLESENNYIPSKKLFQVHVEDDWLGSWIQWLVASVLCLGVVVQFLILGCFSADGWVAAKLVMFGIVTEQWGSQSASAVCALLRMKKTPTPRIELIGKVTDASALKLAQAIVEFGSIAQTQTLALQCTQMTVDGVRKLCEVVFNSASALASLDFSEHESFGDGVVEALEEAIAGTESRPASLRLLRLCNCSLTSKSLEVLGGALSTSIIRTLDLSMNNFRGGGVPLREILENAAILRELRLIDCQLEDEDIVLFAPALARSEVTHLDLAYNQMTIKGVQAFLEPLPESCLEHLSLANNNIESEPQSLAKLAGSWASGSRTRESTIDLRGNPLSTQDLEAFNGILATLLI